MLVAPVLALCSLLPAQEPTPATAPAASKTDLDASAIATSRADRVAAIALSAADPTLEGHGPCRWVEYVAEFSGTLHVWTKVGRAFDTFLRVEDGDGNLLAEDDDSGGGPVPYVKLEVEPRTVLAIAVAASKTGDTGEVELHLVAAPETETTRAEALRAKQELDEIMELREAGDLSNARTRAVALVEHLARVEGGADSELVNAQAWLAGFETQALALLRPTESAWRAPFTHRSRTLPPDHTDLQGARLNLAATLATRGDFAGACALEEQALDIFSRTLPDDHPDLQGARLNLAATLYTLGDLAGARALEEQVLEVCSRTLPEDHPHLQTARGNLALTVKDLGDLAGARALEEAVLEVRSRTLPADHPDLQTARLNLAATMYSLGDLAGARALFEQVLEVRSRTLPADHPDLQLARLNLAATLNTLGDLAGARALKKAVLEVFSRTLPADHPDLQIARGNLAGTMLSLGDRAGARALFEQVLEVQSRTLPTNHPDLQRTRQNFALTLRALGDLAGARALFEQELEVISRTLPDDHPDLQMARRNLAFTLASECAGENWEEEETYREEEGRREEFANLAGDFIRSLARSAREALLSGSCREAEERCANLSHDLGRALSFAEGLGVFGRNGQLEYLAFLSSEGTRGAPLASASLARRAAAHPRYEELHDEIRSVSAELARLAQGGASVDEFDRARSRRDMAERELVGLAGKVLGAEAGALELDLAALSAELAEEDAIVGYRRYKRSRVEADGKDSATESLCAFVVRADEELHRIELGPIEPIEKAVEAWREAIGVRLERGLSGASAAIPESLARGEDLRHLVFDPLVPAIADAERLVVALDDILHLVPLEALPSSSSTADAGQRATSAAGADAFDGVNGPRLVGDRWRIETRCTLTELLTREREQRSGDALVALGSASFNSEPLSLSAEDVSALEERSAEPVQVASLLRGRLWERGFEPLTYSGPEARGIAALYAEAFDEQRPALVLEKRKASRAAVEELAPKTRFLHIAAHGWFAPESIRSLLDPEPLDAVTELGVRMGTEERVRGMAPMLLCGLALAGANLPENELGRAPGLMTAEEISTLDLTNCELAVLSACDTNVGERRAGQGVASLQRALHMAGARSVITSLWKVPDEATKELMLDFYRRIWVLNEPKHDALWAAKRKLRDAVDERGNPKYTTRDWAAWVLTGEQE